MTYNALIYDLERVIRLILRYPQGLSILLGAVPPPASMDIVDAFPGRAFDSLGIRGGRRPQAERRVEAADRIDDTIRKAGGWGHIVSAVCQWKKENPDDWSMMAAHISWFGHGQRWISRAKLSKLAAGYGCSERTISRKRNAFPGVIADYILFYA
ncbi:MAG: hypothetical protein LBG29_03850 [Synergistaceae bacterium]|nr:hypothetical protein [Synergistaceae bacterium]